MNPLQILLANDFLFYKMIKIKSFIPILTKNISYFTKTIPSRPHNNTQMKTTHYIPLSIIIGPPEMSTTEQKIKDIEAEIDRTQKYVFFSSPPTNPSKGPTLNNNT